MSKINIIFLLSFLIVGFRVYAQDGSIKFAEIKRYSIPEAKQGVAVDEKYFYVVDDRQIAKYEKGTGNLIHKWIDNDGGPIIHLDSGAIIEGLLVCAHSNYSGVPMTSSVEVWDRTELGVIFTIRKKEREVVVFKIESAN